MSNFLRPEHTNNPFKREEELGEHARRIRVHSVVYRLYRMWYRRLFAESQLDGFLFRHSARSNVWKWTTLAAVSFVIGQIGYYVHYKVTVYEPAMVQNFGADVPFFRKFAIPRWVQYHRAKNVHFYKYKLSHFVEE
jgi:hypothetical protein